MDLPIGQAGIEDGSAVMTGDVFVNADFAGLAVDLNAAEVKTEAVGQRRVDLVIGCRRCELRRAPGYAFAQAWSHTVGKTRRRPMRLAGDAMQALRICRIIAGKDFAVAEIDAISRNVERGRGDTRELFPQAHGRDMHGARCRGREPAGIIASSDRPAILLGVGLEIDHHILDPHPELIGDDLSERGLVALALRH